MPASRYTYEQNIAYYDFIAGQYDDTLNRESSNAIVRKKVAEKFGEVAGNGLILDFGGGTGRDLEWLTRLNSRIILCEPSAGMREIAMRNHHQNNSVFFLNAGNTDFYTWHHTLPFMEKVDAVLSNFAVFNCIRDISSLFKSLALVMKPGAHLMALILDNRFEKMMQMSRRKTIGSVVFRVPFKFYVHSSRQRQTVYIHTDKAIKKASGKFFKFINKEDWEEYGFCLVHLVRK